MCQERSNKNFASQNSIYKCWTRCYYWPYSCCSFWLMGAGPSGRGTWSVLKPATSARSVPPLERWSLQPPQNSELGLKGIFPECKTFFYGFSTSVNEGTANTWECQRCVLPCPDWESVPSCGCLVGCPADESPPPTCAAEVVAGRNEVWWGHNCPVTSYSLVPALTVPSCPVLRQFWLSCNLRVVKQTLQ